MNPDRLLAHFDRLADAPDAVPRLRRFILDLAVRGKLVEQSPSDEAPQSTPSVADVKKEHRRPRGKTKPATEQPYALPKTWRWVRIGDQLELLNGMAFKPSDWVPAGIRIVRIQNLNRPDAPFNFCEPKLARERSLIDDGTFLISWSGTPGTSFGAFIWDRGPAVLNQHIFRCDFKTSAFSAEYLQLAINGRLDEMIEKAHGGVGLQHITKGKLEAMLIGLPPLAEQRRIVAKVDELMALCDRLEAARNERESRRDRLLAASLFRLSEPAGDDEAFRADARFTLDHLPRLTTRPEHVKQLRQTILDFAVRGRLVPQDPNDEPARKLLTRIGTQKELFALERKAKHHQPIKAVAPDEKVFVSPSGWEWTRWGAISHWITYGFTRPMPHTSRGVPIVTAKNVNNGRIVFDDVHFTDNISFDALSEKDKPRRGDILLTKDGAIGRSAWVDTDDMFCINQSVAVIWLSEIAIDREFLVMFIHSDVAQKPIQEAASGSAIKHISITNFARMPLALPPLAEQHRIVAKVDALMALCDRLEASLAATEAGSRRLLEAVLHEALAPASDFTIDAVA